MSELVRVVARERREHEAHAGALFEVGAGVRGWAPHRFAG